MKTLAWYEHFKTRIEKSGFAMPKSDDSTSLLKAVLNAKIISNSEYLSWAIAHYQLPVLNSLFFKETHGSAEFYRKWATQFSWSNECLPVAEWDGALIIACLNPPQGLSLSGNHILVLASSSDLDYRWNEYNGSATLFSESKKAPSIPSQNELPEGLFQELTSTNFKTDSASFDDLNLSFDKESTSEDPSENNSLEASESEENSESDEDNSLLDLSTPNTDNSPVLLSKNEPSLLSSVEESLAKIPEDNTSHKDDFALDSSEEEMPESEMRTRIVPMPTRENIIEAKEKKSPPPPPEETMTGFVENESSYNSRLNEVDEKTVSAALPEVPKPRSGGVSKPFFNPASANSFLLERFKKKNRDLIEEKISHTFKEMEQHFSKVMILSLDESNSQLLAFAWNAGFSDAKDTTLRIPLKTPSIFNIPVSTQKSFHGYISINPINETFFENWTESVIPDHVTLVPVIEQDIVIGLIMGIGEKSAYNSKSLSLAEQLAQEFTSDLSQVA